MAGDTSLVYNILARDRAGPVLAKSAADVRRTALASAASTALMGAAWASAGAWAIALGAAVRPAVGAIALVPAAAFAAAGAVGALAVASRGMGAAWTAATQATAGGGASAASTARQVAAAKREVRSATQALADATRAELVAQQAISQAYEDATERMEDLARTVAGARLDEQGAVLAVAEAQAALNKVRSGGGGTLEIRRAQLAYQQSIQTLDEVRDRLGDLTRENERAQAAGVAGSTEVAEATERHDEATRRVTEATERLAQAQEHLADAAKGAGGGVDRAAQALAKLSPNARAVITTLLGLRAAWGGVKREVSDATWANVARDIRGLSATHLPVMRQQLVAVASSWNVMIRSALGMLQARDVVDDIRLILGGTAYAVGRVGQALTHALHALIGLGAGGTPFLTALADAALRLGVRFERWVAAARESGKLNQWIGNGITALTQLGSILGNLASIMGAIFRAGQVDGLLGDLDTATARMAAFLNSTAGQEKIAATLGFLRDILGTVVVALGELATGGTAADSALSGAGATFRVAGEVMKFFADHLGVVVALLPILIPLWAAQSAGIGPTNALLLYRTIVETRLVFALRAHTTALLANTQAQNVNTVSGNAGLLARVRATGALVAQRVATIASSVAMRAATVAQWLWNASLWGCPVLLIVAGVIALVAGFIYLWRTSEGFRNFWIGLWNVLWGAIKFVWDWVKENWPLLLAILMGPIGLAVYFIVKYWDAIKSGASAVWQWIVDKWNALIDFFGGLGARIAAFAKGMWHGMIDAARGAFNIIIRAWNSLDFGFKIRIPDAIPFFGGKTYVVPDLIPDLPYLDVGGQVDRTGMAVIHKGEKIIPAETSRLPAAPPPRQLQVTFSGATDSAFATAFVRLVREGKINVALT